MILCAGEALIDMLPRQTASGEPCFLPAVGGAVFNTAIALGRLGIPTGFASGLSNDLFGQRIAAHAAASGVDIGGAARLDRPTTLAFVELVDGQATYAFYDENTAGRMLRPEDLPASLDGVDALFFGGISLPVDPCGAAYEALCLREAPARVTMIDPNIRPAFITDPDRYRARIEAMLRVADVVKVSDEDLHWLFGAGNTTDLARRMLDMGPRLICLTEGVKGATAHHRDGQLSVPATSVTVVDTVGAGDTFNAGVLAGLHDAGALTKRWFDRPDQDVLEAALTLGVQAAAVTVSRAGANPPTRVELH